MKRLHLLLTVKDSAANIPKNLEARRRLQFFANSLFMDMPSAKPVSEMVPFRFEGVDCLNKLGFLCYVTYVLFLVLCNSVFTPYYSETVLYSSSEIRMENEDGISILFYLQKIFPGTIFVCLNLVRNIICKTTLNRVNCRARCHFTFCSQCFVLIECENLKLCSLRNG